MQCLVVQFVWATESIINSRPSGLVNMILHVILSDE